MNRTQLIQYLYDRCRPDGDCLVWAGAADPSGTPKVRVPGMKGVKQARRLLLQAQGRGVDGLLAVSTCGNPKCMKHIAPWTRTQLQQRNATEHPPTVLRKARISAAMRAKPTTKLTADAAADIRYSGISTRQAAVKYGVSQSAAADVRRGHSWLEYSTPGAGLL